MPPLLRLPPARRSALPESAEGGSGEFLGIGFAKAELAEEGCLDQPGLTALTRMFRLISSEASVRVKLRNAAFSDTTPPFRSPIRMSFIADAPSVIGGAR